METLNLEQEPFEPTARETSIVLERTSLVDLGVECKLRPLDESCIKAVSFYQSTYFAGCEMALTEDNGVLESDELSPDVV